MKYRRRSRAAGFSVEILYGVFNFFILYDDHKSITEWPLGETEKFEKSEKFPGGRGQNNR